MDLARIEEQLRHVADVIPVDPRSLRHVIKQHLRISGMVPHGRCYAIPRAELADVDAQGEIPLRGDSSRAWLLLVVQPSPRELRRLSPAQVHERVLRAAFHASVHRALQVRGLGPAELRIRIDRIGRTEFEEIRATLAQDDLLLPPGTDLEVYVEFCAVYLELARFAPELIEATFPGLGDLASIERIVAEDVDVAELLAVEGPASMGPASMGPTSMGPTSRKQAPASVPPPRTARSGTLDAREHRRLMLAAEGAAQRGDFARAALLAARATGARDEVLCGQAHAALEHALSRLSQRVRSALHPHHGEAATSSIPASALDSWRRVSSQLALRAAGSGNMGASPEAKTLRCLQRAAEAFEQPGVIVDAPSWLLSRGKRAVVRPRDTMRELQVMQLVHRALEHAERAQGPVVERTEATTLLQGAARRAEDNVRRELRPRISRVLRQVGLSARSGPERQARNQLVEELLDRIVEQGYLSLSQLRDAISRNEIKLPDLAGKRGPTRGDPLLLADAQLEIALDGIYRRGDIYLRILQQVSSLPFGTRVGRVCALYFVLPLLGAFVVLEGIRYVLGPLLLWLGFPAVDLLTWKSFAATTAVLFCLLHSEDSRVIARQLLEGLGVLFAWIFFRIPRALLTRPTVQRLLARPAVRGLIRCGLVPAGLGAIAYGVAPISSDSQGLRFVVAFVTFTSFSALFASPVGWWLENLAVDHLAPTWHTLSRHWIPQLLRLIGRTFRTLMDALERWINWIDDALRFRKSDSKGLLIVAGAAGAVWAVVGYVLRLYITLLVEPEINPLKHFPVVTVAHKVLLPFTPDLLRAFDRAFSVFGDLVGGAAAGVTVFLLPSVFGFLVWELKENYRLYRATRSPYVPSARFGPHGETMQGLLVVGVHSGTLPKLYERFRRAAQRHDASSPGSRRARREAFAADFELRRFRKGLGEVERSLRHFVQRELVFPLQASSRWALGAVSIGRIESSSNRIRIQLRCAVPSSSSPSELTFEQLGGSIVASLSEPGFVAELEPEQARMFENALAVFYHRAQVDLVREQLESELPETARYQIVERALLVGSVDDEAPAAYALTAHRPRILRPRGDARVAHELPELDSRRVLYPHQRIAWARWEEAWAAAGRDGDIPRLLPGPSLLPTVSEELAPA